MNDDAEPETDRFENWTPLYFTFRIHMISMHRNNKKNVHIFNLHEKHDPHKSPPHVRGAGCRIPMKSPLILMTFCEQYMTCVQLSPVYTC